MLATHCGLLMPNTRSCQNFRPSTTGKNIAMDIWQGVCVMKRYVCAHMDRVSLQLHKRREEDVKGILAAECNMKKWAEGRSEKEVRT